MDLRSLNFNPNVGKGLLINLDKIAGVSLPKRSFLKIDNLCVPENQIVPGHAPLTHTKFFKIWSQAAALKPDEVN